jgi:hypothetical protein
MFMNESFSFLDDECRQLSPIDVPELNTGGVSYGVATLSIAALKIHLRSRTSIKGANVLDIRKQMTDALLIGSLSQANKSFYSKMPAESRD